MLIDTRSANESSAKCLPDFTMEDRDVARFLSKVARREPERCWEWIGARATNGYGMFKVGGKVRTAHRLALFIETGRFGEVARHSCDNRACVNPSHLQWGTQRENVADAVAKGTHGQRHPKVSPPKRSLQELRLRAAEAKLDVLSAELARLKERLNSGANSAA